MDELETEARLGARPHGRVSHLALPQTAPASGEADPNPPTVKRKKRKNPWRGMSKAQRQAEMQRRVDKRDAKKAAKAKVPKKPKNGPSGRRYPKGKSYGTADIMAYFDKHPTGKHATADIKATVPPAKRKAAETQLAVALAYLAKKGTLKRVGKAMYQLSPSKKPVLVKPAAA